jgi:hypothetical protein
MRSFQGNIVDEVYADAYWPRPPALQSSEAEIAQSGTALVCSADEPDWVQAAAAQAARDARSRRIDIEIARSFLGIASAPQRYVIFIIPPR